VPDSKKKRKGSQKKWSRQPGARGGKGAAIPPEKKGPSGPPLRSNSILAEKPDSPTLPEEGNPSPKKEKKNKLKKILPKS